MTEPTHGIHAMVSRIEVINPEGSRAFVAYYTAPGVDWQLQDQDPATGAPRTLKLFPRGEAITDWIDASMIGFEP